MKLTLVRLSYSVLRITAFACLAALAESQSATAPSFQVTTRVLHIKVEVTKATALGAVIEELCQQTRSACEGAKYAYGIMLPPMKIAGPWTEVVTKLMSGSTLGYLTTPPTATKGGKLIIQPRSGDPVVAIDKIFSSKAEQKLQASPGIPTVESTQNSSREDGDDRSPSQSTGNIALKSVDVPTTAEHLFSSPLGGMTSSVGSVSSEGALPIPDPNGRVVPSSTEPMRYLPFPDADGRLIPVGSGGGAALPFPSLTHGQTTSPH